MVLETLIGFGCAGWPQSGGCQALLLSSSSLQFLPLSPSPLVHFCSFFLHPPPSFQPSPPNLPLNCGSPCTVFSCTVWQAFFNSVVPAPANWAWAFPKTSDAEILTEIPDHLCVDMRVVFSIWQMRFKHTLFHFYTFVFLFTCLASFFASVPVSWCQPSVDSFML